MSTKNTKMCFKLRSMWRSPVAAKRRQQLSEQLLRSQLLLLHSRRVLFAVSPAIRAQRCAMRENVRTVRRECRSKRSPSMLRELDGLLFRSRRVLRSVSSKDVVTRNIRCKFKTKLKKTPAFLQKILVTLVFFVSRGVFNA